MPRGLSLTRPSFLLCGLASLFAGCAQPEPRQDRIVGDPALRAERVAEALRPFDAFLGDWQGASDSYEGTFTLARRVSWLVAGSWLLQQDRVLDGAGNEIRRSAAVYTFDPDTGLYAVHTFAASGAHDDSHLILHDAGMTWEFLPAPGEAPTDLVRNALVAGEWHAQLFVPAADGTGGWQPAGRFRIGRRKP